MNERSKLLAIASYNFIPPTDGGKRAVYYFQTYLGEYFDTELITTSGNVHSGNERFRVNDLLGKSRLRYINPLPFFKLRKKIKAEKIQWLLLEQVYFGWLGVLLKVFTGVHLIIRHHNIEALRFRSLKKWWAPVLWVYEKYICRIADLNF